MEIYFSRFGLWLWYAPGWFSHYTNNSLNYLYDASAFNNYPFSTFVFRKLFRKQRF